jgi:ribosomal protein S18 acetylase RimI-like enzyme
MIRPATNADLPAVARLAAKLVAQHHAFDPLRFFVPDRVEEGYAWWFDQELRRPQVVLLVAEDGESIVGYVYARTEERDWNALLDACGAIHDIYVEETERRRGVATQLARAALEALERKGAPRVVLHTAAPNVGAHRFFEKLGFRRTMIEMTREAGPDPSGRGQADAQGSVAR